MAIRAGNRIGLLQSGRAYFPALISAIDAAEREIHLESYIYDADATGMSVAEALIRAARRGVRVRVLLDGFGSRIFPAALVHRLRSAGVALMFYRPEFGLLRLKRHRLRRMHRKIAVIDARLAFVGGINIIDDSRTASDTEISLDYAVQVEGPLLIDIYAAVRHLWWRVRWSRIGRRPPKWRPLPVELTPGGSQQAEFLLRDNLRWRRTIEQAYLEAIQSAEREILIANAYFLPGRRFRRALVEAAARGVRVTLLMQGRTDHRFFQMATRALYGYFLECGVRIFEHEACFLHAKAAVIDGQWATVGSSNIDPFSLLLAKEANVVIRDAVFAGELQASLEAAMAEGARQVSPGRKRLPLFRRTAAWVLYGAMRLVMGLVGIGSRE